MPNRRERLIEIFNNDVTDDHIKEFCKSKGFKKEIAFTVISFLSNTIDQVCEEQDITPQTLDYRINKLLKGKFKWLTLLFW